MRIIMLKNFFWKYHSTQKALSPLYLTGLFNPSSSPENFRSKHSANTHPLVCISERYTYYAAHFVICRKTKWNAAFCKVGFAWAAQARAQRSLVFNQLCKTFADHRGGKARVGLSYAQLRVNYVGLAVSAYRCSFTSSFHWLPYT